MHSFSDYEWIRTWHRDGFVLDLWDTHRSNSDGKAVLAYRFQFAGNVVFEGEDYCPSPLHSIDGDESVAGILTFLSLRPGDTDAEYFDRYTPLQIEFARENGEVLAVYAADLEEALA